MSCCTFESIGKFLIGDCTQREIWVGNHLSFHILVLLPSPTLHIKPSFTRSRKDHKLLQVKEGPQPNLASTNPTYLKYFSLIIFATSKDGWFKILQHCLASIALLKHSRSQNPSPPFFFDSPFLNQLLHWIFLSSCLCPHQNLAMREDISLQSLLGNLKTLIAKVGIAWTTVLRKICLLAYDRKESFQLLILYQTLSFMFLNVLYLDLPIMAGRPRCLS